MKRSLTDFGGSRSLLSLVSLGAAERGSAHVRATPADRSRRSYANPWNDDLFEAFLLKLPTYVSAPEAREGPLRLAGATCW
jgi:hypothetical protein